MNKIGKKWKASSAKLVEAKLYTPEEAVKLVKETSYAKFDASVDISIKIDYKSLQNVRGLVRLPHGNGKNVRVLVLAREDKFAQAKEAGAEFVGGMDLIEKIQKEKWTDFDACVATPDMMKEVGKIGQILGKKGLMPKPKAGTVTNDVGIAVKNLKSGQSEYKCDKTGVVHLSVGRSSFDVNKLKDNVIALYQAIIKDKPSDAKGEYVKSFTLSATMGPGIRLNHRLMA